MIVKLTFDKECIELKPDTVLEIVFIEEILKLIEGGDVAVCYRVDKPQGEIDKLVLQSKKKLVPIVCPSRERAKRTVEKMELKQSEQQPAGEQ